MLSTRFGEREFRIVAGDQIGGGASGSGLFKSAAVATPGRQPYGYGPYPEIEKASNSQSSLISIKTL